MSNNSNYNPNVPSSNRADWSSQYDKEGKEETEHALFFNCLRQHGAKASMIIFQMKTGRHHALPIHEIEEISYLPEGLIALFFRFGQVILKGRNLLELYEKLCESRVIMVRDYCDKNDVFFDPKVLLISEILYESENIQRLQL